MASNPNYESYFFSDEESSEIDSEDEKNWWEEKSEESEKEETRENLIYWDAQEWLDKKYPVNKRDLITQLDISNKNLEGFLEVEGFSELKDFACYRNQITVLVIDNCSQSRTIICSENQLEQDLTTFAELENLEYLYIDENPVFGSLEPLQNLIKLRSLFINKTELDSGLEYLPESLERFDCRGTKLAKQLEPYFGSDTSEKYKSWKKEQKREQLIKLLEEENKKLPTFKKEILRLTNLIKSHKEKIIEAYTSFFQEKELLRELITAHLEYRKAPKEQKVKLRKQKDKIRDELEERVSEELMGEVEVILEDCEELIRYETELQTEINKNQKMLEETKQQINNYITVSQGNVVFGNTFWDKTDFSYSATTFNGTVNANQSNLGSINNMGAGKQTINWNNQGKDDSAINWTDIHHDFTDQSLINQWTNHHFTYHQTQEWVNAFGNQFNPQEITFYAWLRDSKQLTAEQALNQANLEQLRAEYQTQQAQIKIPPKS